MNIYDCRGIPLMPGDTIKVLHYTTGRKRRRKWFMYKWVEARETLPKGTELLKISHLSLKPDHYYEVLDGRTLDHVEILQGYGGVQLGQSFRDRERGPK